MTLYIVALLGVGALLNMMYFRWLYGSRWSDTTALQREMMFIIILISVCCLGGGTLLLMMTLNVHTMPQMFAVFIAVAGSLVLGTGMIGNWLGRKMRTSTISSHLAAPNSNP